MLDPTHRPHNLLPLRCSPLVILQKVIGNVSNCLLCLLGLVGGTEKAGHTESHPPPCHGVRNATQSRVIFTALLVCGAGPDPPPSQLFAVALQLLHHHPKDHWQLSSISNCPTCLYLSRRSWSPESAILASLAVCRKALEEAEVVSHVGPTAPSFPVGRESRGDFE